MFSPVGAIELLLLFIFLSFGVHYDKTYATFKGLVEGFVGLKFSMVFYVSVEILKIPCIFQGCCWRHACVASKGLMKMVGITTMHDSCGQYHFQCFTIMPIDVQFRISLLP